METKYIFVTGFASIFLIVVLFFAPLALYIFDINFYDGLYDQNGVYLTLEKDNTLSMTEKIIGFFRYQDDLDGHIRYADKSRSSVAFFTENEISHMVDVRALLLKIFILFYGSLIILIILLILLILKNPGRRLAAIGRIFVISSSAVLFIFILLYFLSMNFSNLFDNFHFIFFPQGNYMFSENSLLITLFSFNFFYQFFIRLVISSSILSSLFLLSGIFFLNTHKIFLKRTQI